MPQVGDEFEISLTSESQFETSDQSTGSTFDRLVLVERVIATSDSGIELEYDFPADMGEDERASFWQYPARVFRPFGGRLRLLDRPAIETRIDRWLASAGLTREACGHWYFTWSAFQIECDPEAVLENIEQFAPWADDLRDGGNYSEPNTLRPGRLTQTSDGPDGAVYVVELAVDPDSMRRARAEMHVATSEIMGAEVTFDEALAAPAEQDISGTIAVTFYTDADGNVRRREKVMRVDIIASDGETESQTTTETTERRLLPSQGS